MGQVIKVLWKEKIVCVYGGILCILLCACLWGMITSRSVQEFEGSYVFAPEVREGQVVYEDISLNPGVYQIILRYRTDQDYSAFCGIHDDSVSEGSLLTNGEHFYAGRAETTFYLWLFEATDELQVVVDYGGGCYVETGNLLIRNTGKLWSILFVVILLIGLLGIIVLCVGCYHKMHGIAVETWVTGLALLGIALLASATQLGGYMYGGADLTYHLMRIEGVKDSLLAGQFPIRIEPEWLYGHGYADGIFYCDVLFYLPALLRIAGFTVTTSYNIYCIVLNLLTAWIAWYCFGSIFRDYRIGLMCSGIYTVSIMRLYRLALVNAVGEGSALTFLPLILWGLYRILMEDIKKEDNTWLLLALGYAGIIQTHVLTCEITAFVTILICICGIKRICNISILKELFKATLGAIGLSFWFIVPFVDYYLTQDVRIHHASERTIQERGMCFAQMFVNVWVEGTTEKFEAMGYKNIVPLSPGYVCLFALLLFVCLWIGYKITGRAVDGSIWQLGKNSVLLACLLMGMTLQSFPWDWIQKWGKIPAALVSSLQFPYRFLGWAMVFLVTVFGCCLWLLQRAKISYWVGTILALFSMLTAMYGVMQAAGDEDHQLRIYNEAGMGFGYISGAEYLIQGTDLEKLSFAGAVPGEHVKIAEYQKRYLQVKLVCENTGSEESYIDFPLLLYKGYQARSDTGEKLQVCYGDNYLVRVILPPGYSGGVNVRFVSPIYWRISELVTVITVLVMCWSYLCGRGKKKKHTFTQS